MLCSKFSRKKFSLVKVDTLFFQENIQITLKIATRKRLSRGLATCSVVVVFIPKTRPNESLVHNIFLVANNDYEHNCSKNSKVSEVFGVWSQSKSHAPSLAFVLESSPWFALSGNALILSQLCKVLFNGLVFLWGTLDPGFSLFAFALSQRTLRLCSILCRVMAMAHTGCQPLSVTFKCLSVFSHFHLCPSTRSVGKRIFYFAQRRTPRKQVENTRGCSFVPLYHPETLSLV